MAEEIKVSAMTFLDTVPDNAKIYVVVPGDTVPYYTTKAALLAGIGSGSGTLQQVTENGNETDQPIVFKDINAFADWRLQIDVGEFWLYRHDGSDFQEKFRIETEGISFFDDDGNFKFWLKKPASGTSNLVAPETTGEETIATRPWVESQIDSAVVGLLDDRGNWNPADGLFPNIGGSGTGGAVLKGDLWTISVAGTLGGVAVTAGDVVRALVDSPGQTASNWSITENNLGYVPENSANKATTMTGNTGSNAVFLSAKAVFDWVTGLLANATTAGITKLYNVLGVNTDGAITQKAVTDALEGKVNLDNWVDYSSLSTINGFSTLSTIVIKYIPIGKSFMYYFFVSGVSNASNFTFTIHTNHLGSTYFTGGGLNRNGGNLLNNAPRITITSNSATISVLNTLAGSTWNTAGNKEASGWFIVESN